MIKSLGLIPARGGSKGIRKKNLQKINGKPLIAYTIEQALKSNSSTGQASDPIHPLTC